MTTTSGKKPEEKRAMQTKNAVIVDAADEDLMSWDDVARGNLQPCAEPDAGEDA